MNIKMLFFLLFFIGGESIKATSLSEQLAYYEPLEYKKFVIVITSYNNKEWYVKNLESALQQQYPKDKFRIIYIDDRSTDGTPDLVAYYVTQQGEWDHFTLIRNTTWEGQMSNHYKAVYLCEDEEIIVHLDGDDFLKNKLVLNLLNKIYNKWDIWLTYGQFEFWPKGKVGFCKDLPADIINKNLFRDQPWFMSHLRTFYAWLFKKINLKDLIYKGSFIPTAPTPDLMFMYPALEMAREGHFLCIPDVLYQYNRRNALSQNMLPYFRQNVPRISDWQRYESLKNKETNVSKKYKNRFADALIISDNNPDKLNDFLHYEFPKISGTDHIMVIYSASKPEINEQYQNMTDAFQNIIFINIDTHSDSSYSDYAFNEHVLIISDCSLQIRDCSMADCIYQLEKTYAQAFFLGLTKKTFKRCGQKIDYAPFKDGEIEYRLVQLGDGLMAWQFAYETYVWEDPLLFSAVLLRKSDIEDEDFLLRSLLVDLKKFIHNCLQKDREIGLFFE